MSDLVIYGATPAGAKLKATVAAPDRVLCFADHERAKEGTVFDGLQVVPAAALLELKYDRLLLTARDQAGTLSFLLKLGVSLERIDMAAGAAVATADARPVAVIYGSKLEALRTLHYVEARCRVLCFCDADPATHGRRIAGRFVVAPADLCALRFDKVYIGVAETYQAVHQLLWHWNIPIEKMDVVPESVLIRPAPALGVGRPRYVIFGAGTSGERVWRHLAADNDIVAFIDNSPAKHGTAFCGSTVHAPSALATLDYDRIAIGSMYTAEILTQLTELGIETGRIVMLDPTIVLGTAAAPAAAPSFWRRLFGRR